MGEIFEKNIGSIEKLYENGQRITGLETFYTELDGLTSGFQKQDLIIIAARPSMGKTALAMNIAENVGLRRQKDGRRIFAGDVAAIADDPHAVFAIARGCA